MKFIKVRQAIGGGSPNSFERYIRADLVSSFYRTNQREADPHPLVQMQILTIPRGDEILVRETVEELLAMLSEP